MKEFRLSKPAERVAGVCATAAMLVAFAALLYVLRTNIGMLIFCGLCIIFIVALLIAYVRGVLRAVAIVDAEKKVIHVRGVVDETVDVSGATMLQTIVRKNGQSTVRILVFSNEDEEIVATVPTMFTFRQGIWADPMAKEMAAELGIAFKQNVPDWEFDKEKYKQHVKEETEREKKEAKERRKKRTEMRIQKRMKQK